MQSLLYSMLRIRMVEEEIAERYADQQMRCPTHLCIGQEAVCVGVGAALQLDDKVYSNHRAHGHYLAKGGDLPRMIAELYGRATGCCSGRGGSMHLIDLAAGFMGATPIVGGTVPLATGTAWAQKLTGRPEVAVAFFGDGCFEEGVVHECLNFAALHRLPLVFVCENNNFSVYTALRDRQPDRPLNKVAAAHGWGVFHRDGNDVVEVLNATETAVHRARNGEGPQFLEFAVYRWREHCGPNFDDELGYRGREEIDSGIASCPIRRLADTLRDRGAFDDAVEAAMRAEIGREITAAFDFALGSPLPSVDDARRNVYAP
jgi:pyruvate dehydrogenase E1 component alpha subunit